MIDINHSGSSVYIGRAGENNFRRIEINTNAWTSCFPNGKISAVFQRPDGIVYSLPIQNENGIISWSPSSTDTYPGIGRLELRMHEGEILGKSATIMTVCDKAIDSYKESDPPSIIPLGPAAGAVLIWGEDRAIWSEYISVENEVLVVGE